MANKAAKFNDVKEAFDMANMGEFSEIEAWLDRETGTTLVRFPEGVDDEEEPLPDDIDDESRYMPIPDKRDLRLGKPLVLQFACEQMPEHYDKIREIFSRRGAYARFKDLLEREEQLDAWYAYETEQTHQAIRQWCADNDIELSD